MLQQTPAEALSAAASVVSFGRGARRGSGFVIGPDRVLTLAYRLRDDTVETVARDGERREGRVLGVDRELGVVVLDVPTGDAPAVSWASEPPQLGSAVFALADPGSGLRVTAGNVSAESLTVRSRHGRSLELIEHTAPLPRGSGGGPLVDAAGAVVGVNALRGDAGFLLALPARAVQSAIERVIEGREPVRLGVALASPSASRGMRRAVGLPDHNGLLVQAVEERSAAERAGVRRGDLLIGLGGSALATVDDLHAALEANARGQAVELSVLRATEQLQLSVDLAREPEE
ncbi:MAG TPA: S1C family serine protease [Solirubrobacteraceae bacterium]|nr:S1C family serine protease [Solirubrobacteraceae bacterium]